jgi:hypothetical protein
MPIGNGNRLKGNNQKKTARARGRKDVNVDFDKDTDQYAQVINMQGGKHMTVLPLGNKDKEYIRATIRGIHHKKVWFKVDDFVVIRTDGNLVEVQGKASEYDINMVKKEFEKMKGSTAGFVIQTANDNDKEKKEESDGDESEIDFEKI